MMARLYMKVSMLLVCECCAWGYHCWLLAVVYVVYCIFRFPCILNCFMAMEVYIESGSES